MKRSTIFVLGSVAIVGVGLAANACSSSESDTPSDDAGGGVTVLPDGAVVLPDGATVPPDGATLPDGAVILPDGAIVENDGGEDGGGNDAGTDSGGNDGGGNDAGPGTSQSCNGLPNTCGGAGDCCASNPVPAGSYNRSNDGQYPATVSAFKLDVYEVTVGRFRNFVNAGKGTQASPPAAGSGAHPLIANSGWDAAWNAQLAANTTALKAALKCIAGYPAWTDAPVGNETKPLNCVTWYEAFAFCAWDGARLPTEAEWNYAASGGNEQRTYPWGATIDLTRASYDCRGDNSAKGQCAFTDMLPVGSKPAGDGKWGHKDLGGNVWEWVLDVYREPYRLKTCTDCADLQAGPNRAFRGGGFPNEEFYLVNNARIGDPPIDRDYDVGFRCAR